MLWIFLTGAKFYTVGLAAVCWGIWLAHNKAMFENKLNKIPLKLCLLHALCFITGQVFRSERACRSSGMVQRCYTLMRSICFAYVKNRSRARLPDLLGPGVEDLLIFILLMLEFVELISGWGLCS